MRVLVVGSGGREHALAWKIRQSTLVDKVYCAPGNGGISKIAECIDVKPDDITGLIGFATRNKIDLTVVGPEAPLANGIVDRFCVNGLRVFGPSKEAARIEASKIFMKELMRKYSIPTADFEVFDDSARAKKYIEGLKRNFVVKADGLAAGKGVVVCSSKDAGVSAVESMMDRRDFRDAGSRILVEECLEGEEASILVITDGKDCVPLASAQDHKRIFDGDNGPNTGGMGAYSPAPVMTPELMDSVMKGIIKPAIAAMGKEGSRYTGVLYAGIMVTSAGPKVLEFNCRFGDPETQAILPRLKSDIMELIEASIDDEIDMAVPEWDERPCVSVVLSSGGYPGEYETGFEIDGLDALEKSKDVVVFHAGTKISEGKTVTSGGRVLSVTALGSDIKDAIDRCYNAVNLVEFEGMHFRRDIGHRALKR
ncbi:MAG: phosphoribosylamine--glycine ligase [Candidatus Omnitrophota bacterium]